MRRLYYVVGNIDDTEAVTRAMHEEGVSDWHLHVLAKDEAGLYTHKIHSANPIQQLDFIHTATRYAFLGLLGGTVIGLLLFGLGRVGALGFELGGLHIVLLSLLGVCFGGWLGGMIGLSRENYKVEKFHGEIESGKYLVMVDVNRELRPQVKEMMNFRFPHIPYRGGSSTFINPFERPKALHHQTTH